MNPSAIGTVGDLCKLHDDLKSGKCHWVKLTQSQLSKHNALLDTHWEEGETVVRKADSARMNFVNSIRMVFPFGERGTLLPDRTLLLRQVVFLYCYCELP